jgi:dipeptidyl aminopeptidase/acylaminoacyl peptidase
LGFDSIRRVLENDSPAIYGLEHLWYVRGGTLFAQPFNPSTQQVSGQATRILDNVGLGLYSASLSVSAAGHLAYRTDVLVTRKLRWFDRSGNELGAVGSEGRFMSNPSLTRDDHFVAVQRTEQDNIDLWSLDLTREGDFVKLTVNPGIDAMPLWSPDGKQIAFNTIVNSSRFVVIKTLDGSVPDERLLLPGTGSRVVCDWSADGRFILYKQFDEALGTTDLWAVPMQGDRTPFAVAKGPSDERDGQFSPDGKLIAYDSDESGRPAIYVQPFPRGAIRRVSTPDGSQPRWRSDGRELFYIAPDGYLMAVPMGADAGPSGIGKPVRLFKKTLAPFFAISRQQYVVSRDGKRFLMIANDDVPTPPINLILNWKNPAEQ